MKRTERIVAASVLAASVLASCTAKPTPSAGNEKPSAQTPSSSAPAASSKSAERSVRFERPYDVPGGKGVLKGAIAITSDGMVKSVEIVEPDSPQQRAFAAGINGIVKWKPVKGLKVEAFSQASLTVAAFNEFLASQK